MTRFDDQKGGSKSPIFFMAQEIGWAAKLVICAGQFAAGYQAPSTTPFPSATARPESVLAVMQRVGSLVLMSLFSQGKSQPMMNSAQSIWG
jgi:hypothetical protein